MEMLCELKLSQQKVNVQEKGIGKRMYSERFIRSTKKFKLNNGHDLLKKSNVSIKL